MRDALGGPLNEDIQGQKGSQLPEPVIGLNTMGERDGQVEWLFYEFAFTDGLESVFEGYV